jgi:hypothetical protein
MTFENIYDKIQSGELSRAEARKLISLAFVETTDHAIIDVNRELRTNIPEIVYGEYKSFDQIVSICEKIMQTHENIIISRFHDNQKIYDQFSAKYPVVIDETIAVIGNLPEPNAKVLVVSGGAADHPVAKEAEMTLKVMGVEPLLFEDRGVAHPTRVLDAIKTGIDEKVGAVIVIAGMEASLATFVSSLVPLPVIGVPTSVGYGYRAKETALISMLASCTPNLTIVNIDGGVRAAVVGSLIAKK